MSFNKFIKIVVDNLYDEQKHMKNLEKLRTYFEKFYENSCFLGVTEGYSLFFVKKYKKFFQNVLFHVL